MRVSSRDCERDGLDDGRDDDGGEGDGGSGGEGEERGKGRWLGVGQRAQT